MKRLMLDHIFHYVEKVYLHVGVHNVNSNNAMRKLPATLTGTLMLAYHGEQQNENNVYLITRDHWQAFTSHD